MAKKLTFFTDTAINKQFDEVIYELEADNFKYKTIELKRCKSIEKPKQDKKALLIFNEDTGDIEYFNPITKKWYKLTGTEV